MKPLLYLPTGTVTGMPAEEETKVHTNPFHIGTVLLAEQIRRMIMNKEFLTSGLLMEAVRKLDYKEQYKVCEAFNQILMEEDSCDDSVMCGRFLMNRGCL